MITASLYREVALPDVTVYSYAIELDDSHVYYQAAGARFLVEGSHNGTDWVACNRKGIAVYKYMRVGAYRIAADDSQTLAAHLVVWSLADLGNSIVSTPPSTSPARIISVREGESYHDLTPTWTGKIITDYTVSFHWDSGGGTGGDSTTFSLQVLMGDGNWTSVFVDQWRYADRAQTFTLRTFPDSGAGFGVRLQIVHSGPDAKFSFNPSRYSGSIPLPYVLSRGAIGFGYGDRRPPEPWNSI